MNTACNEWSVLDWLNDARHLINWVEEQNMNTPLILVIRHSHREDSANAEELSKKLITDLGHRLAFCFGQKLPSRREVELYYIGLPRCRETAQEICQGYIKTGGKATLVTGIQINLVPQGSEDKICDEMVKGGSVEFIKRWIDGKISSEIIMPSEEFRKVLLKETLGCTTGVSSNSLHIYVTHDLHVMTLRSMLFRTTPSTENWTPYLGGFGMALKNNEVYGFSVGKEIILDNVDF